MKNRNLLFSLVILGWGFSAFGVRNSRSWDRQFCVAHRGYSAIALENSRQAFALAYLAGAKIIEFDVHHTLDGVGDDPS